MMWYLGQFEGAGVVVGAWEPYGSDYEGVASVTIEIHHGESVVFSETFDLNLWDWERAPEELVADQLNYLLPDPVMQPREWVGNIYKGVWPELGAMGGFITQVLERHVDGAGVLRYSSVHDYRVEE